MEATQPMLMTRYGSYTESRVAVFMPTRLSPMPTQETATFSSPSVPTAAWR